VSGDSIRVSTVCTISVTSPKGATRFFVNFTRFIDAGSDFVYNGLMIMFGMEVTVVVRSHWDLSSRHFLKFQNIKRTE
jgi:hypothetical protein